MPCIVRSSLIPSSLGLRLLIFFFTVGAKLVAVCYYDEDQDFWVRNSMFVNVCVLIIHLTLAHPPFYLSSSPNTLRRTFAQRSLPWIGILTTFSSPLVARISKPEYFLGEAMGYAMCAMIEILGTLLGYSTMTTD